MRLGFKVMTHRTLWKCFVQELTVCQLRVYWTRLEFGFFLLPNVASFSFLSQMLIPKHCLSFVSAEHNLHLFLSPADEVSSLFTGWFQQFLPSHPYMTLCKSHAGRDVGVRAWREHFISFYLERKYSSECPSKISSSFFTTVSSWYCLNMFFSSHFLETES